MRQWWKRPAAALLALGVALSSAMAASAQTVALVGAGATFPFPLYSKWSEVYVAERGVQINYQSIGSGGGIRQFIAKTVDFGASDGPMTDEQIAQAGGRVLHIPMVAGAVVPVYNVPGVGPGLNFTPEVLAGVFLGKVTKWNDPQIVQANPKAALPSADIVVVHRSDGSGTTMSADGSAAFGLACTICGSFHFVTLPRKTPASTSGEK